MMYRCPFGAEPSAISHGVYAPHCLTLTSTWEDLEDEDEGRDGDGDGDLRF